MSTLEITLGVVLIIFAIAILMIVLMQEGHQSNPGVVTGSTSDTFLSKNKGRSIDAFLERWTKFIAVGFFLLVIATNVVLFLVK